MKKKAWVNDLKNTPVQYQRGWTEFFKLKFKLTSDVLIPRPETELLVEQAIKLNPQTVIDVGTGSGCIAISLAKNLPSSKVFALDISEEAIKVAEQNSKFHQTEKQVLFMKSDLLSVIATPTTRNHKQIDVIIANLPYIPSRKLMFIDPMVRDFEPKIALDGGVDGFEIYRRLFAQIKNNNVQPKCLLIEIDEDQSEIAQSEARKYFPNSKMEVISDLANKPRIMKVNFNP